MHHAILPLKYHVPLLNTYPPLASGRVELFINYDLNYTVLEKVCPETYQALWIEITSAKQKNIICGIIYRQHNPPDKFLEYFSDTTKKLISSGKTI